jgi:hypothetical protein
MANHKNHKKKKGSGGMKKVPGSLGTSYSIDPSKTSAIPPVIADTSLVFWKRYSTQGTSGTVNVTRAEILNCLGCATAANLATRIFNAVRIRRIRFWAQAGTSSSYQNISSFQWTSEDSPSKLICIASGGAQFPTYIESRPPKNCLAGFWCYNGYAETATLMQLNVAGGAVLDVEFEATVFNNYTGGSNVTFAVAGATATDIVVTPFDGLAGKFPPVAQSSI